MKNKAAHSQDRHTPRRGANIRPIRECEQKIIKGQKCREIRQTPLKVCTMCSEVMNTSKGECNWFISWAKATRVVFTIYHWLKRFIRWMQSTYRSSMLQLLLRDNDKIPLQRVNQLQTVNSIPCQFFVCTMFCVFSNYLAPHRSLTTTSALLLSPAP